MIFVFFVWLLCSRIGDAQAANDYDIDFLESIEPLNYVAYRTLGPLEVDGKLDEPSWQRAAWSEHFVDIEGERGAPPRQATRVKMLWDDDFFYIAADLQEPQVWATLTQRDATIYRDNDFEVFIDPDGDTHLYYEFEINAHGTEWDLLLAKPYRNGGPYINAWHIDGLRTAVKVWGSINDPTDIDQGWSVEMAFPWSVLRQAAQGRRDSLAGQVWRVNFSRVQWALEVEDGRYVKVEGRSEDNWVWSPQGLVNMHFPEQWGYVLFASELVGLKAVPFVKPPAEEAKKALRSIYYRQHRFRAEHGHFTNSLDSLEIENPILRNYIWPPALQVTDRLFEASLEEVVDLDEDGRISRWVIAQDGRTWKD